MISKPINLINAKMEEMYDGALFWFYTTIQAMVFDANNFCYRISQLTQLTSPERFDQMNYVVCATRRIPASNCLDSTRRIPVAYWLGYLLP